MAKGRKTGGRLKGTPNRATADVRRAFADLLERNADKFNSWLTRVAATDPARALELASKLAEYHIPKLGRVEHTGHEGGPLQVSIQRFTDGPAPE